MSASMMRRAALFLLLALLALASAGCDACGGCPDGMECVTDEQTLAGFLMLRNPSSHCRQAPDPSVVPSPAPEAVLTVSNLCVANATDTACDTCLKSDCCAQALACFEDAACETQDATYTEYAGCANDHCAAQCPGVP